MNLKTNKFKRNSSGRTQIYEYTPPINALVTPLSKTEYISTSPNLHEGDVDL
jgi:hypothetical protein